jgi:Protein of unknown function (DUF3761)
VFGFLMMVIVIGAIVVAVVTNNSDSARRPQVGSNSPSYLHINYPKSSTATAVCADGTYSYSAHRQGTCSGHGGIAQWLP